MYIYIYITNKMPNIPNDCFALNCCMSSILATIASIKPFSLRPLLNCAKCPVLSTPFPSCSDL